MGELVRVNAGYEQISLPDGLVHTGPEEVALTDVQFASIPPRVFDLGILTDLGFIPDPGESATEISFSPHGSISSTNVQAAIEEVALEGGGAGSIGVEQLEYRHVQSSPASVWTIAHNLGYRPGGVYAKDSGGTQVFGRVNHIDADNLTISFFAAGAPVAVAGEAFLS